MPVPIYVVDAFTSRPFAGNPAGVCVLDGPADSSWMQSVAAEMKHAETAFATPRNGGFELRWFTPAVEVDLCGHATLATAHILWETGRLAEDHAAYFHTKSGVLTCTRHGYGIQMDFPSERATESDPLKSGPLLEALGLYAPVESVATGIGKLVEGILGSDVAKETLYVASNRMDYLVEVSSAKVLRELTPDFVKLEALGGRGVIVTAKSDREDYDFLSRFFAPAAGIPEDPVTGSAHCCLGPYWSERLGKTDLVGYQCSQRGGTVRVAVRGDRVLLQGHAITVLTGELLA